MTEINLKEDIKRHACDFCAWFMQLSTDDLIYYIIEAGSGNPVPQYYTREEMYDKFIKLLNE